MFLKTLDNLEHFTIAGNIQSRRPSNVLQICINVAVFQQCGNHVQSALSARPHKGRIAKKTLNIQIRDGIL